MKFNILQINSTNLKIYKSYAKYSMITQLNG